MSAGPYSIGSETWPGLAKVAEEAGELLQVIGKIIAAGGAREHWDGTDLRVRLEDELADFRAAAAFLASENDLNLGRMRDRMQQKQSLFQGWHEQHRDGSLRGA